MICKWYEAKYYQEDADLIKYLKVILKVAFVWPALDQEY